MEKIVIATVLLSLLSGQAFAAPAPARYYAGAKIGINSVQGAKTNALGVLGGYRVGPDFALEAAYINLGSAEDGVSNGTVKLSVIEFGGVALFPITGQVSFLGKLGDSQDQCLRIRHTISEPASTHLRVWGTV